MLNLCFLFWQVLGHRTFPEPRLEAPQVEQQALPPPVDVEPPVFPKELESPPAIAADAAQGADEMDVDPGDQGDGVEPMTIDRVQEGEGPEEEEGDTWLKQPYPSISGRHVEHVLFERNWFLFSQLGKVQTILKKIFGGQKVRVDIPESSVDELTGAAHNFEQVKQGMLTEVQQLERLKVGKCLIEKEGRALAKEKRVTLLTSRWVLTQKTADIARCRIVVRDFATGSASALNSGIYAPTSSLDGLRCVLAVSVIQDFGSLLTADVSVAFMNAPVEEGAVDLVLLPGKHDNQWYENHCIIV